MMGSGVYCDAFSLEHALTRADHDGVTVREALTTIGYDGAAPASISAGAPRFGAYFEAHIEQGPVLEDADILIGAVTGALGQRWYDVVVSGMEAHAGPTPMHLRKDALFAATHLMQAVVNIALAHQPNGRGTVGCVHVHPNSRNVIPGKVSFTVDFRHADDAGLVAMDAALHEAAAELQQRFPVQVEVDQVVYFEPVAFAPELVGAIRAGAERAGCSHLDIVSGAGHDAVYVARTAPTAMIFVPCKDGISHNEIEDADPAHLEAGANVLLHAILARAGVA
ncbi:MAG: hydantoinase/carbamoylase family amidase, partial [Azoarcus sp.]|nr:hydantoinase/carbamoylase family amidase [Azoarcus sp.]